MKQLDITKIYKALSNPHRYQLFKMLHNKSMKSNGSGKAMHVHSCCKGIDRAFSKACKCLNLSRSTISHHFKELQNAGLITCTREGQHQICEVNEEAVELLRKAI